MLMNELEEKNLHEHLVRKSVSVLLFKGGLVFFFYYAVSLFLRWMEKNNANSLQNFTGLQYQSSASPLTYAIYIWPIFFGLVMLVVVLSWVYEYYIFKLDRIIVRKGILFSSEAVYEIENIHAADVFQGLVGKILDTGTLILKYGARGVEKTVVLKNIPRPYHVLSTVKNPSGNIS